MNLKQIKSLKTKKGRNEHGLFIIEGEKFVSEIPPNWSIHTYICAEDWKKDVPNPSIPTLTVSNSRFASLSDTVTPQGIMAVCKKHNFTLSDIPQKNPFILIGEDLNDPGNIGTLIRTAAAANASACILSSGSGDIYNPKTIRASAGAVFRIPIIEGADLTETIYHLKQQGILIIAAQLKDAVLPYQLNLKQGCAILIGNEARGLSNEAINLADINAKLPMAPNVESLNASVAGGILLYEVVRQRLVVTH